MRTAAGQIMSLWMCLRIAAIRTLLLSGFTAWAMIRKSPLLSRKMFLFTILLQGRTWAESWSLIRRRPEETGSWVIWTEKGFSTGLPESGIISMLQGVRLITLTRWCQRQNFLRAILCGEFSRRNWKSLLVTGSTPRWFFRGLLRSSVWKRTGITGIYMWAS